MEVQGTVLCVTNPESFSTRNGMLVRHGFVIETGGRYPKKMKFDVLEDRWAAMKDFIINGNVVSVSFEPESREWRDKWFTALNAWRASLISSNPNPKIDYKKQEEYNKTVTVTQDNGDAPF